MKPKQEPTKPDTVKNTAIGLGVLAAVAAVAVVGLLVGVNPRTPNNSDRRRRRR